MQGIADLSFERASTRLISAITQLSHVVRLAGANFVANQTATEGVMAMYRVRFQKEFSLATFLKQYGTEEACEAAVVRQLWGAGFVCTRCRCSAAQKFRRAGVLYQ